MHTEGNAKSISIGKKTVLRNRTYELFGFGCYYAWFLSIVVSGSYFGDDLSTECNIAARGGLIAGLALGYAILFILRKTSFVRVIDSERILGAGIVGTAGTLLTVFLTTTSPIQFVVAIASLLAGLGNAYLMMAGGDFWSSGKSDRAMMQLTSSTLAATLIFMASVFMPSLLRRLFISALPAICAVILATSTTKERRGAVSAPLRNLLGSSLEKRFIAAIALTSCAFGLMLGQNAMAAIGQFDFLGIIVMSTLISSTTIFLLALKLAEGRFLFFIIRTVPLCMVLGCFITLFGGMPATSFGLAAFVVGFLMFDAFLWLLNSELIHRTQVSASEILPRFELIEWLGIAAGFALGALVFANNGVFADTKPASNLVCGILIVVALFGIFSQTDAATIIEARCHISGQSSIEDRCQSIAESRSLTKREHEVLLYLARGRSLPFISKELCIAEGTTKSHVRHIYEKLQVTSKQELIDLIDSPSPQ